MHVCVGKTRSILGLKLIQLEEFSSGKSKELQQLAFDVIRPWLQQCDADHPCECGGLKHVEHLKSFVTISTERELPTLPTRVIDVGIESNSQTKLHISQPGERGRYLTLSYRWGEGNDAAMTTAHNIAARVEQIDVASLPNTIKDAIDVTRAMGIAYIWIDALCIIQATYGSTGDVSDPGDFKDEAYKMSTYYGNSYCTIAATAAENTAQGFVQSRKDDVFADSCTLSPWLIQGARQRIVRVGPGLPRWKSDVKEASMYKRAWILQERALSTRVLHWGRGALWWECPHQRASEFLPRDAISVSFDQNQPYMQPDRWLAESSSMSDLWRSWTDLIREYSAMDLGRESDRLIALQGLVDVVSQRFTGEIYLFGLWKSHLPQSLCWEVSERRQVDEPIIPCKAPSWSWAACPHPVMYMYPPTHPRAELVMYDSSSGSDFQCRLRIKGLLEKAPFGKRRIVREYDDGRRYKTKNYFLHFDSCPLESPQMLNIDLFLLATFDWDTPTNGHCATHFLLLEPVEHYPNHYRRIGSAMRWTKRIDWKGRNFEEVDIYLV